MNDQSIVLSISMLISGREEMFRSLESLRLFKETFPCEVILVDTGCSREQRKKAEKYADKIVDFTWCDDFAAARNAGLKEACGEWFLYLDDDEWFDNPKEIIVFFTSGESKKYNCASYMVRNYLDSEGVSYEDTYPLRMARRTSELEFVGKIHEYLYPTRLPKKVFSDFVHHFGYVYRNVEERDKHAERNIVPLLEMCRQYPGNPRWTGQLAQEYFGLHKYEEVIKVCIDGLKEWRARKGSIGYVPAHVGLHYAYILTCLEALERYEEEEEWLCKAFEEQQLELDRMEPTVAYYCLMGITLYHRFHRYELCRNFFQRYLNYAKRLKDDRMALENGAAAIVGSVFQKHSLYSGILTGMESAIRMEDYALAKEAFHMLDWTDKGLMGQEEWEEEILDAFCSVEHHPLWVQMLQTLISRKNGMKEMLSVFKKIELAYRRQENKKKLLCLQQLVAELDYDHYYILYMKILWIKQETDSVSDTGREDKVLSLFRQLFEHHSENLLQVDSEVWKVGEQLKIPMEPLFLQTDFCLWRRGLERWCQLASLDDIKQWDTRIKNWKQHSDIRYDFFTVKCFEVYLRNNVAASKGKLRRVEIADQEQLMWQYADKVLEFYKPFFKDSIFDSIPEALPSEVHLAIRLKELQQYREQGDDLKCLTALKKCVGVCPTLEGVIEAYASMYREELQKRDNEAEAARKELIQLIGSLIKTAKVRIDKKDYQGAKEILIQVQQCVPEDKEIQELLQRIDREG